MVTFSLLAFHPSQPVPTCPSNKASLNCVVWARVWKRSNNLTARFSDSFGSTVWDERPDIRQGVPLKGMRKPICVAIMSIYKSILEWCWYIPVLTDPNIRRHLGSIQSLISAHSVGLVNFNTCDTLPQRDATFSQGWHQILDFEVFCWDLVATTIGMN